MLTTIITALAGVVGVGFIATLAYKAGAGKAIGDAISKLPTPVIHSKSAVFNDAANAAIGPLEAQLKSVLSGDSLQAFLAFLQGSPSEAQVLAYLEKNFGQPFLSGCAAQMPALLQAELGILGGHLPSVVGGLLAKLAPKVAVSQAQQQLTAAQVSQQIAALAGAKVA